MELNGGNGERLATALDRSSLAGAFVAAAGLVFLFWKGALFGGDPVSIGVQVATFALLVWARVTFGMRSFRYRASPTAGGVVTHGPYRYVRHPIYAALLGFSAAGVASHWSAANVIVWFFVLLGFGIRIVCEERLLRNRYPAYVEYASRTKRVIPFVA